MAKSNKTVAVTVSSYLQYLQQSPSDRLSEELSYAVTEKRANWEVSISRTKASLARANKSLQESYRNADLQQIIDCTNTVKSYTEALEIAEAAFAILFPVEAV